MSSALNSRNYNLRILNADEFSRSDLLEIFAINESLVPNPLSAHIQIAENEEGKIIAIAVLQPQYHLEPIYVDPEYRDTNVCKDIIETTINLVKNIKGLRIFAFSPDSRIAKLAIRFGFKFKNYEVFVREF